MDMKSDIVIIGGGIMGLMSAYYACRRGLSVAIVEKSVIGRENKISASFSLTRSIRNDYLDSYYGKLAAKSRLLWDDLTDESGEELIINCGCLNIADERITPLLKSSYAFLSNQALRNQKFQTRSFNKRQLVDRYPRFKADYACLDVRAGVVDVTLVTKYLIGYLLRSSCSFLFDCEAEKIVVKKNKVLVTLKDREVKANSLIITAGLGSASVLKTIDGNTYTPPLFPDKPLECKYIIPKNLSAYSCKKLPVFAYLDVGIYGHPWMPGRTKGIKIGFYRPPKISYLGSKVKSVEDFIDYCMPNLKSAKKLMVKDADQCSYDMTPDNDFIIGGVPGFKNIFLGCGWNGTGYKFAPLIGKSLIDMTQNSETGDQFKRFDPARFT